MLVVVVLGQIDHIYWDCDCIVLRHGLCCHVLWQMGATVLWSWPQFCVCSTLMMEEACFSEMCVPIYQTVQCHNWEVHERNLLWNPKKSCVRNVNHLNYENFCFDTALGMMVNMHVHVYCTPLLLFFIFSFLQLNPTPYPHHPLFWVCAPSSSWRLKPGGVLVLCGRLNTSLIQSQSRYFLYR